MVPERGLEPPLPCENQLLKLARLPIPPLGHECRTTRRFSFCPPHVGLSNCRVPDRVNPSPGYGRSRL
jgi:hypothetical protein